MRVAVSAGSSPQPASRTAADMTATNADPGFMAYRLARFEGWDGGVVLDGGEASGSTGAGWAGMPAAAPGVPGDTAFPPAMPAGRRGLTRDAAEDDRG